MARKRVEERERAIKQEQEDIRNVENMGVTTRDPEKMLSRK